MKQTYKRILATATGVFSLLGASAQDVRKLYSLDHYTGVANVQIPITSYLLKNNELGLSLFYNTKGVPVRELAGPAGLHWNLNVGGGISRVIKGLPDEWYSYGSNITDEGNPGNDILRLYSHYKGRLAVSKEHGTERDDLSVYRDPESDEYTFSVGNIQFTFYIGLDGDIYFSSKEKYDIKFFSDGMPYALPPDPLPRVIQDLYIQVTDKDNGMTYYFSPSVKTVVHVLPYFRSKFPWISPTNCGALDMVGISGDNTRVNTGWKLDKITTTENETVEYSYKTFVMPYGMSVDSSWTQSIDVYNPSAIDTSSSGSANSYAYASIVDTFQLVNQINFPYGKSIELQYDTVNTRLEFQHYAAQNTGEFKFYPKLSTVLYKEQGQEMKYTFDYSYFHTPSASHTQTESNTYLNDEPDRYSLKLKGINVIDPDALTANPLYTFTYNDSKQRRHGKGLDYYGYYNGGSTLLGQKGHSIIGLSTRTADSASMQYGILKTITTATGSKATFAYGVHTGLTEKTQLLPGDGFFKGTVGTGDGLKLNSVEISDVNDPTVKNSISYTYSGGQYILPGGMFDIPSHFANKTDPDVNKYYRYENFMNPAFFARGTNHGYSTVTETLRNIDNEVLGSTSYQLTNFQEGTNPPRTLVVGGGNGHIGFPFTRKQYVRSWELGLPTNVKVYDNNGLILKEDQYTYNFVTDSSSSLSLKVTESNEVVCYVIDATPEPDMLYTDGYDPCADIHNYRLISDPYRPYKGYALLSEKTEKAYQSNTQYTTETTAYSYDAKNNPKSIRTQNSDGNYTEQYNVYNYDIPSGSSDVALTKMSSDEIDRVVATETWFNGTNSGTRNSSSQLLNNAIYKYTTVNDAIVNKIVYSAALEQPLDYTTYMGGQSTVAQNIQDVYNNPTALPAYLEEMTNVQFFNEKGNPTETYVPQAGTYKSMIWDTVIGKKTADVVNAKRSEIVYAGFDHEFAGEYNLVLNSGHLSSYNGSSMSLPSVGFTIPVSQPLVGKGIYVLEPTGGSSKELYCNSLESGKSYRATFWASQNAVPSFGIEGGTQFSLNVIAQKGEYKQYEVLFSPTAANQKIGFHSNSGYIALEEIRIHPADATMENYRYTPLFGTSVTTDALGRMTFYEYDGLGRLVLTRDQQGNILKKTEYGINTYPTN